MKNLLKSIRYHSEYLIACSSVTIGIIIIAILFSSCKKVVQPDPVQVTVNIAGDTARAIITDSLLQTLNEGDSIVFKSSDISDEAVTLLTDEAGNVIAANKGAIRHRVTGTVKRVNGKLEFRSTSPPLLINSQVTPRPFQTRSKAVAKAWQNPYWSHNWKSDYTMWLWIFLGLLPFLIMIAYLRKWQRGRA
jgi:hypothetical protein